MSRFMESLAGVLVVVACGCGSADMKTPPDFPKLFSCEVTVTQDGAPLAQASIQLVPSGGEKNWFAGGMTGNDGKVKVYTYGKWIGAPASNFKVTVSKITSDPSKFTEPSEESGPARDKYEASIASENLNSYQMVEKQYTAAASTTLTLEVKGATTKTFDVGKAAKDKL